MKLQRELDREKAKVKYLRGALYFINGARLKEKCFEIAEEALKKTEENNDRSPK